MENQNIIGKIKISSASIFGVYFGLVKAVLGIAGLLFILWGLSAIAGYNSTNSKLKELRKEQLKLNEEIEILKLQKENKALRDSVNKLKK